MKVGDVVECIKFDPLPGEREFTSKACVIGGHYTISFIGANYCRTKRKFLMLEEDEDQWSLPLTNFKLVKFKYPQIKTKFLEGYPL